MHLNTQRPLPVIAADQDGTSLVTQGDPFLTIQGEGPFAGHPAVFVRLYGCTLKCPKCDTDYTSDLRVVDVQELVRRVVARLESMRCRPNQWPVVVVTGGEPFRQNLRALVRLLTTTHGLRVQIETNGHDAPTVDTTWNPLLSVVVSPKLDVHPEIWKLAGTAKYVLSSIAVEGDGLPNQVLGYQKRPDRPPPGWPGKVYVQPQDDQDETINQFNTNAAVASALKFGYIVSLQQHKILGVA